MNDEKKHQHQTEIVNQFSKQAIPFTQVPGHFDAMQILIELSGVGAHDDVLDVACGPGMVACEFARHAKHVTGLDITPAMIDQAKKRQAEEKLSNLEWIVDEAVPLPFPNNSFSLVITRYSFHHMLSPTKVLAEMIRVCRPGGRVLVADVSVEPEKSGAYDRLEIMRDPSHVHALTNMEFDELFKGSGLIDCGQGTYGVDIELESQLKASFPKLGDEPILREMVTGDIGKNKLGINTRSEDGKVVYTVPIAVYFGRKK